jgi:hypothetical protein
VADLQIDSELSNKRSALRQTHIIPSCSNLNSNIFKLRMAATSQLSEPLSANAGVEVIKSNSGQKTRKKIPSCNINNCKYDIVSECTEFIINYLGAQLMGLKITNDDVNYNLFWIDTGVSVERLLEM